MPIDLWLDANEGPPLPGSVPPSTGDMARRYPESKDLERAIATTFDIDPRRVVVTCGGDDAIARLCMAFLEPGRTILLHDPTFVMIARSARLTGAAVRSVEWLDGPFPVEAFTAPHLPAPDMIALVSPNNPTGQVMEADALARVLDWSRERHTPVLFDGAYAEFAQRDPTPMLLTEPHVTIVRTFSKAFGLAGLRVGYAIAPPSIADRLRAVGSPYPTSGLSIEHALHAWTSKHDAMHASTIRIAAERETLTRLLRGLRVRTLDSQANFVLALSTHASTIARQLAACGIAVRSFGPDEPLKDALRITLPGQAPAFDRLCRALTDILTTLNAES
jgi:histidinol-phosphate aminotransferase